MKLRLLGKNDTAQVGQMKYGYVSGLLETFDRLAGLTLYREEPVSGQARILLDLPFTDTLDSMHGEDNGPILYSVAW